MLTLIERFDKLTKRLRVSGRNARATVVRMYTRSSGENSNETVVRYAFTLPDGEEIRDEYVVSESAGDNIRPGDSLDIRYLPQAPRQHRRDGQEEPAMAGLMIATLCSLLWIGAGGYFVKLMLQQPEPRRTPTRSGERYDYEAPARSRPPPPTGSTAPCASTATDGTLRPERQRHALLVQPDSDGRACLHLAPGAAGASAAPA
ncbi:DUF3592 domain-containing protein [Corallococcus exiguus]|nr:DUF3592 domain-containing protein [Corallococcus exiguus]NNB92643.1 DUF3592 domain-containing protein [Corallococcus exiguus]